MAPKGSLLFVIVEKLFNYYKYIYRSLTIIILLTEISIHPGKGLVSSTGSESYDCAIFNSQKSVPKILKRVDDLEGGIHLKAGNAIRTRDINLGKVALYH